MAHFDGKAWCAQRPEIETVHVGLCDMNGVLRGKRLMISQLEKVMSGQLRMPLSACSFDIWGTDIDGSELVFESGDRDGICIPTERGAVERTWTSPPSAFVQVMMQHESGAPLLTDPRQALVHVLSRFKEQGWSPIVAMELEFYLVLDQPHDPAESVNSLASFDPLPLASHVLSLDEIDYHDAFIQDVYKACDAQNIPIEGLSCEAGAGQFELNLHHGDALRMADDVILLKALVKGVARTHGFRASFMAKPFGQQAGNGLHVHMSVLDAHQNNIFDDGTDRGSDCLLHAVCGVLNALPESMLIFAPHLNSYRRFLPNHHAPTIASWGYENRTCAVRVPGGAHRARRLEHRVAGADANPYLVLCAILGAAFEGMMLQNMPRFEPINGDAAEQVGESLAQEWGVAIDKFTQGTILPQIFDPMMLRVFAQTKEQERRGLLQSVSDMEYHSYFDAL